ncbi:putative uncharacterized protein [Caballeronia insecticola]|uniref:Uncharacterized protein n=1 Tax=Caballeronia insecticola TaxID=758793 RepID=R4WQN3_9BURK|nr:putative uncharacterized protein [Caballeronia insecticola]
MLSIAALLALSIAPVATSQAADAEPKETLVEPMKAGGSLKLYASPDDKESAGLAPPEAMPLHVTGTQEKGFYPVAVGSKRYWVDGMDIKMRRDNRAKCNASASVHAAGQLGAATNRCQ